MMAMLRILSMRRSSGGKKSAQYGRTDGRRQTIPRKLRRGESPSKQRSFRRPTETDRPTSQRNAVCERVGLAPHYIIAVDPDTMMMAPGPMPRYPDVIHSTGPVARAVNVIRLVTDFDVNCD